jgi:hypothetical protein
MAISRIRGEQIKQEVLKNVHIAADAAIAESKLDINWANHYQQALITKKVVDFVQVNGTDVGGATSVDVTALGIIPAGVPNVNSDPLSGEGVIIDAPKNKVPIRDSVSGDPVLDEHGHEVYGRMVFENGAFVVKFFTDEAGVETAFTMPAGQKIDWQYAKRFNLDTVSEMFAANEKFVEGAADATAHLNINQLAKDLYGASFSLDRDGNANLATSLVDQIANEVQARQNADQAIRDDLASTAAGKGANLIGVEDLAGKFTATTVEGVLKEIDDALDAEAQARTDADQAIRDDLASTAAANGGAKRVGVSSDAGLTGATVEDVLKDLNARLTSQESGGGAEVTETHDREVASANGYFAAKTGDQAFASLEDRLLDIETVVDAKAKVADDTAAEVQAARGSAASLDARLDRALNEDGTLKAGRDIHKHYKAYYQAIGGEQVIDLAAFNVANLPNYQVGDNSLDVYVNGILQNEGLHYAEVAGGASIDFSMGDGTTLVAGDIVTIKYHINNAE